ncbi:cytochrome P450 [Nonomuraea longispora]|uniref:Cytochrome P450 n=1 Tax=Nonomuraea longispora TaxID=1848320 RepID=A0A4V2XJ37_9ACTN|nr:cytochrome P450 [Nonomuraea longispora]TDC01146.1 cytochrome P450 [Nonomuraea longispora]
MPTETTAAREARSIPFYRLVLAHRRSPVKAFEEAARRAAGEIVRLETGLFRPYLVTHPDHVQHLVRHAQPNYLRQGLFWDQLAPVVGEGILSEGDIWRESRDILQPLFTARYVDSLGERMTETIDRLLEQTIVPGKPFDVADTVTRVVHPAIVRLFFGGSISDEDIRRLQPAYNAAITSQAIRLLLPTVPAGFPLPGDRAFRRAFRIINEVVYPRIHEARAQDGDERDVVSALCRARRDEPGMSGDRKIRNDLVSMYGAATETSATVLTWALLSLHNHPEIAVKVQEEIDRVVGGEQVSVAHLPELHYLGMFLQEVLRLYPGGWLMPRRSVATAVVDGVTIRAGSTVITSPYLTHRLADFWDRPLEFDPDRFAATGKPRRHRYAYFPFGGGPHQCLGQHLFMMEAKVYLASLLSRHRVMIDAAGPISPRLATVLQPDRPVTMTLTKRS